MRILWMCSFLMPLLTLVACGPHIALTSKGQGGEVTFSQDPQEVTFTQDVLGEGEMRPHRVFRMTKKWTFFGGKLGVDKKNLDELIWEKDRESWAERNTALQGLRVTTSDRGFDFLFSLIPFVSSRTITIEADYNNKSIENKFLETGP